MTEEAAVVVAPEDVCDGVPGAILKAILTVTIPVWSDTGGGLYPGRMADMASRRRGIISTHRYEG